MPASQKAPWEKKAAELKKAYEKDMEEFKAKGGVAGSARREKAESKRELLDKRAKKRARREANADKPKRPPSAFWLYLQDNRAALVKEAGTAAGPAISKLGSEKWKNIDKKTEAVYQKQAVVKKAEYDKAMKEYKEKKGTEVDEDEEEEEEEEDEVEEQ